MSAKGHELKRVLFIPDTHIPYHDRRAWKLMLQVPQELGFHTCRIGGDFWDCYAVSAHSKNPNRLTQVEDELEDVNKCLDQLDACGFKRKVYVEGNHEFRLKRALQDKMPQLYNMVTLKKLLRLKERGWEFVPYMDDTLIGKLYTTHCIGNSSNAMKAFNKYQDNVVTDHNHAIDFHVRGNAKSVPHVSATFGWLGDVEKVDYMHKINARTNWALGFGVGFLEENGCIHLQPAPLVNYRVVVEGRLFKENA